MDVAHKHMIQNRHYLHSIPELYFKEYKTSKFISEQLELFGLEVHKNIAGTGLIGILRSNDNYNKQNIAIRAEMDALPIHENNNKLTYKSINKNNMHACGHDGHMAIVLGIAEYFSNNRCFEGTIYFIFSPAEEDGAGCKYILEDNFFKTLKIDEIFAIHNWPDLEIGKIGISESVIMGGDNNFSIKIIGKGGHGAMPEHAINPNHYVNKVVKKLKLIQNKYNKKKKKIVLTPTSIRGGDGYNVIPESLIINGTFRYLSGKKEQLIIDELKNIKHARVKIEVDIIKGYPPTINHKESAKFCKKIVKNMEGVELVNVNVPSMATEDFSYLLQEIKGCYVWLGSKDKKHQSKLHNCEYDFNDDILKVGFKYFHDIILSKLPVSNETLNALKKSSNKSTTKSNTNLLNTIDNIDKSIIPKPAFTNNVQFLGFIQLATDYTLDMEISDLLGQIEGIGWRIKKLPYIGNSDINNEMFSKLKDQVRTCARDFIPQIQSANNSNSLPQSINPLEYGKLDLISIACTSMSFMLGPENIHKELKKGYNTRTTDTTTSIINAINSFYSDLQLCCSNKKLKISLLTPYIEDVHTRYIDLLKNNNCDIIIDHNLNLKNDSLTSSISVDSIEGIIDKIIWLNEDIDLFIIGCSALNVTHYGFIDRLEKKYKIPFITSNQALLWNSLYQVLSDDRKHEIKNIVGYGKLFGLDFLC
jgi:amidohydrolase